jgi:hypothetical protein
VSIKSWVPVLLGVVALLSLAFGTSPTFLKYGPSWVVLGGFVLFYVLINLAPWLTLRTGIGWWISGVVVLVVGVAALFTDLLIYGFGTGPLLCWNGPCPATQPPPAQFGLFFTIAIGVLGLGQAFSIRGRSAKVLWVAASIVAGAALGFGIQLSTGVLRVDAANLNYVPAAIGGAAWGIVMAVAVQFVKRVGPDRQTA